MNRILHLPLLSLILTITLRLSAQPFMVLQPHADPEAPNVSHRVIWSTDPGVRYELQLSTDLSDPEAWETVAGYPSEAAALAQQEAVTPDESDQVFYRVVQLDEQPPSIVHRSPADGGFGIRRFRPITVNVEDATGIDPGSISFSLPTHGTFTVADEELSLENGVVTFDLGGDTALGGWGDMLEASITVSDTLGNTQEYLWSFELETEPQVEDNLFVFGSPDAQRAGQRLGGAAAALAARFNSGPVRMADTDDEWSIHQVLEDRIVLAYVNDPPAFTEGSLLANLAPAHVDEIFYRRVDAVQNDPDAKQMTLLTIEVGLLDILPEGTFSLSDNDVLLELDENGALIRSLELDATFTLPSLGADFSGTTLFDNDNVTVSLTEGKFFYTPSIQTSLETRGRQLRRFEVQATGDMEVACFPLVEAYGFFGGNMESELWQGTHWVWGTVGIIPIGVEVTASVKAKSTLYVSVEGSFESGYRQHANMGISGRYRRDANPEVEWNRWYTTQRTETQAFTYNLNGSANGNISLVPSITARVYGVAGIDVSLDPRIEFSGQAQYSDGQLTNASWELGAYADVNAGMNVRGVDSGSLPRLPSFRLYEREWASKYSPPVVEAEPPEIIRQPRSITVYSGESAQFYVEAKADAPVSYQWFHQGVLIPGQNSSELLISQAKDGASGSYFCRVSSGGLTTETHTVYLSVETVGIPLATKFQYPFGDRTPVAEFPDGTANERNDLYPDNPGGDIYGRADHYKTSGWFNYQDVGSHYPAMGGIHPGEDWNKAGGDVGEPIYPVAVGRIVQIAPTSGQGVNPSAQGWRIVIEHTLAGELRRPGDSLRYYSIYAHLTADQSGSVSQTAMDFPSQVGQVVSMEQPIGWIANIASPHLHLEMRRKVREINQTSPVWPNTSGGYYSNAQGTALSSMNTEQVAEAFNLMQAEGIIDPSDFIDDHLEPAPQPPDPAPAGMARIPAGWFTMGRTSGDTDGDAPPVNVYVSDFYMARHQVTWELWNEVRDWAVENGYTDIATGDGKGADHPVHTVNWWDVVKWLNARSEREGLDPVYRNANGTVFKTGTSAPIADWNANGYRLPTEAEWEKAARGGVSGQRFPWGDTINISNANYRANGSAITYDTSPYTTWTYHPTFNDGTMPYTSPVGSFAASGYGLYDMSGNVWDWCWDWYSASTYTDGATDPKGAPSGTNRVGRGGSWRDNAWFSRSAYRGWSPPDRQSSDVFGFRPARSSVP